MPTRAEKDHDECRSTKKVCFHTGWPCCRLASAIVDSWQRERRNILLSPPISLGDDRNNEQPGLTSLHTIFVRLHNRFAEMLGIANKHWEDEKVFQEARKILIAVTQHITYK